VTDSDDEGGRTVKGRPDEGRGFGLLTLRGRLMFWLGILVVVISVFAGQRDVMRVGLFLVAIPVIAVILVSTARLRLSSRRSIVPRRVQLGTPMVGRIRLSLESRLPIGMVMLEDNVPPELGQQPRFSIDRPGMSWEREIEYPLLGRVRGRWRCGPLSVLTTDPFGLVRREQQFTTTTEVLVTPQIFRLTPLTATGGAGSSGESQPHRIGMVGADDVLIREYRHGDDVRRVHWRSTARRGDLMVRREEQAWDPAARVILDSRAAAHAGSGIYSSLEWAVSAVASIGLRFIEDGFRTEVYEADGPMEIGAISGVNRQTSSDMLISRLTDLRPRRTFSLRYALDAMAAEQSGELVVAVLGRLSADDARALLLTKRRRTNGLAMLLDVDTFSRAGHGPEPAVGPHRPGLDGNDLAATARLLQTEGWRVVIVSRGMSVVDAWASFDRAGQQAPPAPATGATPISPSDDIRDAIRMEAS
jgi:uncharacterized protein (DUF58 family)